MRGFGEGKVSPEGKHFLQIRLNSPWLGKRVPRPWLLPTIANKCLRKKFLPWTESFPAVAWPSTFPEVWMTMSLAFPNRIQFFLETKETWNWQRFIYFSTVSKLRKGERWPQEELLYLIVFSACGLAQGTKIHGSCQGQPTPNTRAKYNPARIWGAQTTSAAAVAKALTLVSSFYPWKALR